MITYLIILICFTVKKKKEKGASQNFIGAFVKIALLNKYYVEEKYKIVKNNIIKLLVKIKSMEELTIKEAQKIVDNWIKGNTKGYWQPPNIMLRLMEEVGELARVINHKFGEKKKKSKEVDKEISSELADVLYDVICIANSLEIDLYKALRDTISKYEERDKNRH